MDVHNQQKKTPRHASSSSSSGKRSITPAHKGPRRLAFRIRRRGFTFEGRPSLLNIDRYGVWSVTHRRYIRKTSYHRYRDLGKDLQPAMEEVRRYKMSRWPEFKQDEELSSLRRNLADLYWSLMPEEVKTRTVLYYRHRRQRRRRLMCFTAGVVLVALEGFVLLRLALMGRFSISVTLFLGLGFLALLFLLDNVGKGYGL